ncbi:MAG: endolytic transglycosylase MltG, partial [Proteobacteria bacterium]|nr:endolytic transglycosylase MltG [Pseudomonadota bacterium]
VDALVRRFREVTGPLLPEAESRGFDLRSWVTLASVVEKETGAAEERALVAAVFRNRLERGMRLESDPTVIYGLEAFDGDLRRADLARDTPYNTYTRGGLPPGPIANPGRASLEAVARPISAPFLFFVSRNDGTHVFSITYEEHRRNVDHYQRRRRR